MFWKTMLLVFAAAVSLSLAVIWTGAATVPADTRLESTEKAGTCYTPCPYCYPRGPHCRWNAGHDGAHMCERDWNHIYR